AYREDHEGEGREGDPADCWRDKRGRLRRDADAWAQADDGSWYDPRPGAFGPSDPGGGPPVTPGEPLRWWYEDAAGDVPDLSWPSLLTQWNAIESDFHHFYGCDLGEGILCRRSWRRCRVRVIRLLAEESMRARALGLHKVTAPTGAS